MSDTEDKPVEARGGESGGGGRMGLIALGGAALIAVTAVGYNLWGGSGTADAGPAQTAEQSQQPSVPDVIAQLEARLAKNPDDAEGWSMLGWSYYQTGQYGEAAQALRRAAKLDPGNAKHQSMLGEALVLASNADNGFPEDALAAFRRALAIDPKDPQARYFLAAAKDMDGKHQEAIDDWFALMADTPADAPYAEDIVTVIRTVGEERGIKVEDRLASTRFAPAAGGGSPIEGAPGVAAGSGSQVATGAIPGPSREQMQAAGSLPPGQQEAMIRQMVDGLAAKLKSNPKDADGWIMLMRSRVQLGEAAKAGQAYADARKAFAGNNGVLAKLKEAAQTLGVPGA